MIILSFAVIFVISFIFIFSDINMGLSKKPQFSQVSEVQVVIYDIKKQIYNLNLLLTNYPNYRDGWFQLATLHWQLYQDDMARYALMKVLEIDPNFEPAIKFSRQF